MLGVISTYGLMSLLLALLWLGLFVYEKPLRKEMLALSMLGIFLLPTSFGILASENVAYGFSHLRFIDLLFTFTIAGIAGVIYHIVLGKHYHFLPSKKEKKHEELAARWIINLLFAFVFFLWVTLLLNLIFSISLAAAVFLSAVMLVIYLVSHRHDLLYDALASAVLTGLIVFLVAELAAFFTSQPFSGDIISTSTTVGSVPLDLILWSVGIGLLLGPIYEYIRRIELT